MSNHTFLSTDLQKYIQQHDIQSQINNMLNQILREQPLDPYAELSTMMMAKSSMEANLINLKAYEIFNSEGTLTIQVEFIVNYLAKKRMVSTDIGFIKNSDNQLGLLLDEDHQRFAGKGMQKVCNIINSEIKDILQKQPLNNQKLIDEQLIKLGQENNYINIIQPISFSIQKIISQIQKVSLYNSIQNNYQIQNQIKKPVLYMPILITNQKCKVTKFYFCFPQAQGQDLTKDIFNVHQAFKKILASGKGGEAAIKLSTEGSYICILDGILENIKTLEDAINASGVKGLKIGLTFEGDKMFQQDKLKYEVEGPKQLFDTDQMVINFIKD